VAEAASRAKDRFLAMLSHELRTPLTPILLTVNALLDDPQLPESIRTPVEMIHRNVELEASLIEDLLDITRIVQGKLNLKREVVDVHPLIRQALAICRAEVAAAGIHSELSLEAAATHVDGDPARLQQVFWNLIKNAVKFTSGGGTLTIRTRVEPAHEPVGPPRLVVEVLDTGIGIAPEMLPKIFDAFEQGGDSVTHRSGGLGLGLAISRSIIELHGGKLSASSAGRHHGATFAIELGTVATPFPSREGASPRNGEPPARQSLRLLFVEDNEDTARVMARLLTRSGHDVTTASNLAAALKAARDRQFDMLISDLDLPDGNGLDLMRQIRRIQPVVGIALSGFGMEDDLRKSREAGFTDHLTKPIDYPRLEANIQRLARSRRRGGVPAPADSRG
jgi:CheY-like chemotaxis protein